MPNDSISGSMTTARRPPLYYRLAIGIAKPLYRWLLWYRHQRDANPYYEQEIADRFGQRYQSTHVSAPLQQDVAKRMGLIWIHAVSLGETNTIAPMMRAFLALGFEVYLTATTHTGHARGRSLFAKEVANGRVRHGFVPVDEPKVIQAFLDQVLPVATLFVETELWANTLYELKRHHIPTFLVNARLSVKSAKHYQAFAKLSQSMMHNLTGIIVQDALSAQRFRQLGATDSMLTQAPSLKWHMQKSQSQATNNHNSDLQALLQLQGAKRPVYVLGSSHAGEEALFLAVHQRLLSVLPNALLIVVPRHPERFEAVVNLLKVSGLTWQRRSDDPKQAITKDMQVYLADSMGELIGFYALADVAVVGGSFVNIGGHNPIEAVQLGVPVIMGVYTHSCQSIVDELVQAGALWQPKLSDTRNTNNTNNNAYSQDTDDDKLNKADLSKQLTEFDANCLSKDLSAGDLAVGIDKSIKQAIEQTIRQLHTWLSQPQSATQAGRQGQALVQSHQQALWQQMQPILAAIGYVDDDRASVKQVGQP